MNFVVVRWANWLESQFLLVMFKDIQILLINSCID